MVEYIALLLAYPVDVGGVDMVPGGHVLLQTRGHAGLLATGEGAPGLGNAFVEATLLEFLSKSQSAILASL